MRPQNLLRRPTRWSWLTNLKLWLPIFILLLGSAATAGLVFTSPEAEKKAQPYEGKLVETVTVMRTTRQVQLELNGRVQPAQRVLLTPQISGIVNWISPQLREGAFVKEGDLLVTLQPMNGGNLDYTALRAPFHAVLQERAVDLGQFVSPGAQLGVLVGSDQAEVVVDLPMQDLEWLGFDPNADSLRMSATVRLRYGERIGIWDASVQRFLPEVTPQGLMTQLVLTVNDPFHLNRFGDNGALPLFMGTFVDVLIPARRLENVIVIPATALRDANTVWVAQQDLLEIRPVDVLRVEDDEVFLAAGLEEGERLIVSPLKGAANGLKVRTEPVAISRN
jgi:multidrug efflux pump subunit AcrA (membrane-fusion protein)